MGTQHQSGPGGGDQRLQRVEEALGVAEHEQAQLGEQVVRLQQQVLALAQRVAQLEGTLERVRRREEGDEGGGPGCV